MSILSKLVLSFGILLLIPGCISNMFKEPKPTFSSEVILPELSSDFIRIKDNVYPAWKSSSTNNVISIVSDCTEGSFSLKSIHNLMSESLDQVKVIEEKSVQIQKRNSYFKKIRGEVDGKPIEIQSYSLQYNKCIYVTSLAGKPEKLAANQTDFKNFTDKIDFKK